MGEKPWLSRVKSEIWEEKTSPFYTREVNIFSTESPEALKSFTSVHSFLKQLLENI